MRTGGHLHRVTIGRTREVRGPDALERALVGLVTFVVMTFAIGFGARHMHIAKSLEAISLASGAGAYYNEIVYWSVHGAWPSSDHDRVDKGSGGRYARNFSLDPGGGITVELALDAPPFGGGEGTATGRVKATGLLSLRPQLLGTRDYAAFGLVCGYAKPLAAGRVQAVNRTTLDRKDLPPFCR